MADKLPQPIFTPSTKAAKGQHDENVGFAEIEAAIGKDLAARVRDTAIALYQFAAAHALERGIIIADTKFEFGVDDAGTLTLIDEALTPDSSRFWPVDTYAPGSSPPSFDKQFVRDYLETLDWNKTAPGPQLPADVLRKTSEKYEEALRRLTAYGTGSAASTGVFTSGSTIRGDAGNHPWGLALGVHASRRPAMVDPEAKPDGFASPRFDSSRSRSEFTSHDVAHWACRIHAVADPRGVNPSMGDASAELLVRGDIPQGVTRHGRRVRASRDGFTASLRNVALKEQR